MEYLCGNCPYCKRDVTFSFIESSGHGGKVTNIFDEYFKNKMGVWVIGECPSCKNCVLARYTQLKIRGSFVGGDFKFEKIIPHPLPSPTFPYR